MQLLFLLGAGLGLYNTGGNPGETLPKYLRRSRFCPTGMFLKTLGGSAAGACYKTACYYVNILHVIRACISKCTSRDKLGGARSTNRPANTTLVIKGTVPRDGYYHQYFLCMCRWFVHCKKLRNSWNFYNKPF
jgi:hypothetical protein